MKNVFKSIILLVAFLFITNLFAGDRLMLIEFFTSSTCGPCAANNPVLTAFLNSKDIERIAGIGFHMNWPAPGNDPMYLYNTADNDSRRSFYGINAIPQGRFDGTIALNSPYSSSTFQAYYNQDSGVISPVSMIVTDSTFGDSVKVRVQVYCEQFLSNPNVTVYIGVVEGHIHYSSPPGTNGETDFYNVMRKMLPNASGTVLTMVPGDLKVIEYKYRMDPVWVANQIYELAWAQDAVSKGVYTAARKTQNFTLIPNCGFKSVAQGQSGSGPYKIKVPVIASGYNLPVTFTAQVTPANSGITTSFPNGNVLSNFPDSISLTVNSTSSVPTGSYQILIKGTNSSGKYHQTVVNYLVGKNYVLVGTNRPNEGQFKVNGTAYTTSQLFEWVVGSTQTIQAISPMNYGDHQVVFQNWSNSGDTTQTITVSSTTSQYIANYKMQYKLNTTVSPSGVGPLVTVTGGNLYYDSSASASVNISPLQVNVSGTNYIFQKWLGAGTGSYTGTNPSFQATMSNYINEIAIYVVNTSVNQIGTEIPDKFELSQNYPNPFNPVTTIRFALPKAGNVVLKVYDILGKEVEVLHNGNLSAGYYKISLDAKNYASGMYFYKIETDNFTDIKRMMLIK